MFRIRCNLVRHPSSNCNDASKLKPIKTEKIKDIGITKKVEFLSTLNGPKLFQRNQYKGDCTPWYRDRKTKNIKKKGMYSILGLFLLSNVVAKYERPNAIMTNWPTTISGNSVNTLENENSLSLQNKGSVGNAHGSITCSIP